MKRWQQSLYRFLQWTWGLPQTLTGALLFLLLGRRERQPFYGAIMIYIDDLPRISRLGSCSLGMFLFLNDRRSTELAVHEYGHSIQSLLFGPLFFPLVGIPSVVWACRYAAHRKEYLSKGISYTGRYPERSASRLGSYVTGLPAADW